jgi:hypothetical protein
VLKNIKECFGLKCLVCSEQKTKTDVEKSISLNIGSLVEALANKREDGLS